MGEMKMENIVPRVGTEPITLAFWASVLTIASPRLPDVTILQMPPCLCGSLTERLVQTTTLVPLELYVFYCLQLITCRQAMALHIHT